MLVGSWNTSGGQGELRRGGSGEPGKTIEEEEEEGTGEEPRGQTGHWRLEHSIAGALTACLAWLAPGIALSEGPALAVTDLSGGWLAGWEWMKIIMGC